MTWLDEKELDKLRFNGMYIGKNVKIDSSVVITHPARVAIGDFCRIDAYSFISGNVSFGRFCHVAPHCVFSGTGGIFIGDAVGFSAHCYLVTNSADFHNESLSLPTIPSQFKRKSDHGRIEIDSHIIFGGSCQIFPNTCIWTGSKFGAKSIIKGTYDHCALYVSEGNKIAKKLMDLDSKIIISDYAKMCEQLNLGKSVS